MIRPESTVDHDAIRALTARAFASLSFSDGTEPRVIDRLREAKALAVSLVAVVSEQLVGHIAFSEVRPPELHGWFALGPLSVEPSFQRRGIGKQLVQAGLRDLRARGAKGAFSSAIIATTVVSDSSSHRLSPRPTIRPSTFRCFRSARHFPTSASSFMMRSPLRIDDAVVGRRWTGAPRAHNIPLRRHAGPGPSPTIDKHWRSTPGRRSP